MVAKTPRSYNLDNCGKQEGRDGHSKRMRKGNSEKKGSASRERGNGILFKIIVAWEIKCFPMEVDLVQNMHSIMEALLCYTP